MDINQNKSTEKHPYSEIIFDNTKYLILGSFPPIKLTHKIYENMTKEYINYYNQYNSNKRNQRMIDDIDFYYGSRDNLFWNIISEVFNIEIKSKDDIVNKFLRNYCFGMNDIVQECTRKSKLGKIESSDASLIIKQYRPVIDLIKNSNIKVIFCTSDFVESELKKQDNDNYLKKIQIISLPSPSKLYSRSIGRLQEYKVLKKSGIVKSTKEYRIRLYKLIFEKFIFKY